MPRRPPVTASPHHAASPHRDRAALTVITYLVVQRCALKFKIPLLLNRAQFCYISKTKFAEPNHDSTSLFGNGNPQKSNQEELR